jgi:general stress protein 26
MKELVYQFINQHKLAVVSTINASGEPESALVGIAVSDRLDIIFDTVKSSRKYNNILQNSAISVVVGWDNETTIQYEGEAEILGDDASSDQYREIYYEAWPDGKERTATWPGLVHIRITPKWIRYGNFNPPVTIEEIKF